MSTKTARFVLHAEVPIEFYSRVKRDLERSAVAAGGDLTVYVWDDPPTAESILSDTPMSTRKLVEKGRRLAPEQEVKT